MEDKRIGNLLFTDKCDIVGFKALTTDKTLLGEVIFQIVDLEQFTVRYLAVKRATNPKIYLIPAELLIDLEDDDLLIELSGEKVKDLLPLPENWENVFNRSFEEKIYHALKTLPYWHN